MNEARALLLMKSLKELNFETYIQITDLIVSIDESQVEDELRKQPSVYSSWHGLMIQAKRELDYAEAKKREAHASARRKIKADNAGKKLTVQDLESMIEMDQDFCSASENFIEAEYKHGLLKGLVRSLEQRKDSLVQLSANNRAENKLYT